MSQYGPLFWAKISPSVKVLMMGSNVCKTVDLTAGEFTSATRGKTQSTHSILAGIGIYEHRAPIPYVIKVWSLVAEQQL
jgi:hypothetical protein